MPKLLYTVPSGHNPTGVNTTLERKRAVYDICWCGGKRVWGEREWEGRTDVPQQCACFPLPSPSHRLPGTLELSDTPTSYLPTHSRPARLFSRSRYNLLIVEDDPYFYLQVPPPRRGQQGGAGAAPPPPGLAGLPHRSSYLSLDTEGCVIRWALGWDWPAARWGEED